MNEIQKGDSLEIIEDNTVCYDGYEVVHGDFFAKVFSLMGWNPQFRYKLLGKFVRSKDEFLFIFDLNAPEVYQRFSEKEVSCLNPVFPEEWKNQFGVPAIEHKHLTQVPVFEEQMIFALVADAEI